ncbi:MAG: transposase [Bacteroidia bacterium]
MQGSRKQFLENPDHRIRFVFTPKHCSWLNPIENGFAKVQRHIIRGKFFFCQGTRIQEYSIHRFL